MSRIVITTFGSFGDVNPYIGLGLELQRRGHHPVLAMPGIFRESVEREGLGRIHGSGMGLCFSLARRVHKRV